MIFEEHTQHTFDSYCKKTLKYSARTYYKQNKKREDYEVYIEDLLKQGLTTGLTALDKYFTNQFSVIGYNISISNEIIAEALSNLSASRRDIILLAYFLEMNDKEIAEQLSLVRRTIAYHRADTLKKLKQILEDLEDA